MKFDDFDKQMRGFEESLNERVADLDWIVLRLDGRGFTKLTKEVLDFTRPFDLRFHTAMQKTCEHLLGGGTKFRLGYTQSDEISLLLRKDDIPFNGKTRKLNSVFAGEASGIFSVEVGLATAFDCRVIPLGDQQNVIDYFRWRAEDARRNGLTAFCYWGLRNTGLSPSVADARMKGLSKEGKLNLLSDLGIDFASQPEWMRLGAFLQWTEEAHLGVDPRDGSSVATTRSRFGWCNPTPEGPAISELVCKICELEN